MNEKDKRLIRENEELMRQLKEAKKDMCECCGDHEATRKDYREQYEVLGKYIVCEECVIRTDRSFFTMMRNRLRRKINV
jgi:hypothetical protein